MKRNLDRVLQADAVYIACTALSTYEAVTYLHEDLWEPAISENTAAVWSALRKFRVKDKIPGIDRPKLENRVKRADCAVIYAYRGAGNSEV